MPEKEEGSEVKEEKGETAAIFPTAEGFRRAADRYFEEAAAGGAVYSEAGLCLGLSRHNPQGRAVTLRTLRSWYDGDSCRYLQEEVQLAYLRIQEQIDTDARYLEKSSMASRGMFLLKQPRFGGYQDKGESRQEATVRVVYGAGMDESDFK